MFPPAIVVVEGSFVKIDKQSSVTYRVKLEEISDFEEAVGVEGDVVLVRALRSFGAVDNIETPHGRLAKIRKGDNILAVLGNREATKAIVGRIPRDGILVSSKVILHLLNAGGVVGVVESFKVALGSPLTLEPLGVAVRSDGSKVNIRDYGIGWADKLEESAPLVMIVSSSMECGKTTTAVELINCFTRIHRLKVCACKLTGVARLKDTLFMEDAGAVEALSFVDAGLPSTVTDKGKIVAAAKGILNKLNEKNPDVIVVELGDSIVGCGVPYILHDEHIMSNVRALILSAMDELSAYGSVKYLKETYKLKPIAVTGPATDNQAGMGRIHRLTGVRGINMLKGTGPELLAGLILESLKNNK